MCRSTADKPLCTGSAESASFQFTLQEERFSPTRNCWTGQALALAWVESPDRSTGTTCQRGLGGFRLASDLCIVPSQAVRDALDRERCHRILALRSCVVSGRYEDYWERCAAAAGILTRAAVDSATERREVTS